MEEEEKKEAIEKTGVDYDKLKEIISTVYPVRYERRTAIAPVLWICGAMFTTSLVWCTVNMGLVDSDWYRIVVVSFALLVAGISFGVAIRTMYRILKESKDVTSEDYNPRWDLLRSEHFLLEMQRLTNPKNGSKEDSGLVGNNHASTEEKNKLQSKDGKESNKKD